MRKFQNENKTNNEKKILKKKEKSANDLIPELILKIDKYSSKLKERLRIYSMFQEFDNYAHMNLQNFIKMSERRYQSIKSGNNLKNILKKQKKDYDELSTKILSNNLYNDENIETEEKKLYKKINNKDNKELYQIRHDIIEKTKDLTKKELEKRKRYLISSQKSRNNLKKKIKEKSDNQYSNNNNNQNSFESYNKTKSLKKSNNFSFNKTFGTKFNKGFNGENLKKENAVNKNMSRTISMNKLNQEKEFLKIKKEYFDNLFQKDNQSINENFTDYKQFLNDIKSSKASNLSQIINDGNKLGHTYSFNFNDIKLLSFQEEKEEVKKTIKKENPEINIGKLVKYTKRGNRKWFLNKIKENSRKRQDLFKSNLKHKKIENNILGRNKYNSALNPEIKENINAQDKTSTNKNFYEIEDKEKEFSTLDSMGITSSTTFSNFRNTIKTVKNEAKMIQNIGMNFINKRKTMEGFFKRFNLPEIKEYGQTSEEINNFINSQNNNNRGENQEKNNPLSKKSIKLNQKLGQKNTKNKFISPKIFADLQRTYNAKKKIWAKEDLNKENIKKEKIAHIESTKKFLEELETFKRKPQLYLDPYSTRDNLVNDRIKLFTRSLSGPFFSQKKIEKRLQDFNNYIEQKEREKKIIDKKNIEPFKENGQLSKDNSEIQNKPYFEKESTSRDDDIKFDYKFISSLSVKKKIDKNKSYKDYKEFWDIVKYKQKAGEYDTNEE